MVPLSDLVEDAALRNAIDSQGDAFVAETEAAIRTGGGLKVRAGQGVRGPEVQLRGRHDLGRGRVVPGGVVAGHARRRQRLSAPLVEALLRRPLVHRTTGRRRGAGCVAELALRLRRQAPPQGLPLPHGRRCRDRPLRVRPGQPAGRPTRTGCGRGRRWVTAASPTKRSCAASRARTSPPSPPRGARSSSATRAASTVVGSPPARPRVLATATYCSPASLRSLSKRNYTPAFDLDSVDDVTRYALS